MCRIMVVAGLKPENAELNWEFIQEMGLVMSKQNNDGLGYTAISQEGEMFGERWLLNEEAFDVRFNNHALIRNFEGFIEGDLEEVRYNRFGVMTDNIAAITLHTRMATSTKGFKNTHPFVDEATETSLIHNGIIDNVTTADNIRSTCDSERILNKYLEHDIINNPGNIQKMVDDLKGYMACGVFGKNAQGIRYLDVFKTTAGLVGVYIKELGAIVFTTEFDHVKTVCKDLGLSTSGKFTVKENVLMRINALTGHPMTKVEFKNTMTTYASTYSTYDKRDSVARKYLGPHTVQKDNVTDLDKARETINRYESQDGFEYDSEDNLWLKNYNRRN